MKRTIQSIIFLMASAVVLAQTEAKGIVVDKAGEPIIGATIVEKGTKNATVSNLSGRFTLTTAANAMIVVSYAGYYTQEQPAKPDMNVVLTKASKGDIYMIDGKQVEDFDGSQLEGKTVKHYDLKKIPGSERTIHNIFTTDDWVKIEGVKTKTNVRVMTDEEALTAGIPLESGYQTWHAHNPLTIVDGKEYTEDVDNIKPDQIKSIDVFKAGSKVANSYGEKGKNGVVMIYTNDQPKAIIYIINGQRATKAEVDRLSPDNIKKVEVLKRGSEPALHWGDDGQTHDIFEITLK